MISKKVGVDYLVEGRFDSIAITLVAEEVVEGFDSNTNAVTGEHTRTHADGWTITGVVVEDYYYWVNDFEATHPIFGKVWGNFEEEVFADSEEGYAHFVEHHGYATWDYYDI